MLDVFMQELPARDGFVISMIQSSGLPWASSESSPSGWELGWEDWLYSLEKAYYYSIYTVLHLLCKVPKMKKKWVS